MIIVAHLFGGPKDGEALILAAATEIMVPVSAPFEMPSRIGRYSPELSSSYRCPCAWPTCELSVYRYMWREPR